MAKKQKSHHEVVVEHQLPTDIKVSFREDSNFNPSTIIVFKSVSGQALAQADAALIAFFNGLLAEAR